MNRMPHGLPEVPVPPASSIRTARVKPRLRGTSHRYAFLASLPPCLLLVAEAPDGRATWVIIFESRIEPGDVQFHK